MSHFERLVLLEDLPLESFGSVWAPYQARSVIMSLSDDLDAIDGGREALRRLCEDRGLSLEQAWWDEGQRRELVEALWELVERGVYVVRSTGLAPLVPAFVLVDGLFRITAEVSRDAKEHFTRELQRRVQRRVQRAQQRKEWDAMHPP